MVFPEVFSEKMQRGRGGRDEFFGMGDPFAGFGGFGRPGSLMPSFFGGRDPFDDPFFTQPFGGMLGPNMFGRNMFPPSMFPSQQSLFSETSNAGFLEQPPPVNKSRGPIIQELSDDDEGEEGKSDKEQKENPRKHSRTSKEPLVQDPDEAVEEKKSRHMQYRSNFNQSNRIQPQGQSFTFQSSTVTYGGLNGAYYTSSTTRRMGGDGVVMEENKEADTTTGRATHRMSRGIRDKGHSFTRKLNSDGRVDTMQTLHNLNEDELPVFEKAWNGKAKQHLPGWNPELDLLQNGNFRNGNGSGSGSGSREEQARGWALPSTEQPHDSGRMASQSPLDSFKTRGYMK
ncbi:myeloid leukemia factor 1-like [Canna indica]|uniref:Myeloid leukemia factor 1-like n=1 Tax=Canna indica TaxID=4628 RepID=A0AAQ3QHP5_9LILI|nr:myeloid leukemia factor 1-like [Canna indica]